MQNTRFCYPGCLFEASRYPCDAMLARYYVAMVPAWLCLSNKAEFYQNASASEFTTL